MAPGRKRDGRREKKKSGNFSVGNKAGVAKSGQSSSTKKAKEKSVSKKKVWDDRTFYFESETLIHVRSLVDTEFERECF